MIDKKYKIVFSCIDYQMLIAWEKAISVLIKEGKVTEEIFKSLRLVCSPSGIFDTDCTAIVSPGNSYLLCDGGLDAEIARRIPEFKKYLTKQSVVPLPVGDSIVIAYDINNLMVGNAGAVVYSPTMTVPMILPYDTINPYLSTLSSISKFYYHYSVGQILSFYHECSIAIPPMGAGIGQVPYDMVARQMLCAIIDFLTGFNPTSSAEAQEHYQWILGIDRDKMVDMQSEHILFKTT